MSHTDAALQAMSIPDRNRLLDRLREEAAEAAADEAAARADWEAERRAEAWYEAGGAHAESIAWEAQQDDLRAAGLIAW